MNLLKCKFKSFMIFIKKAIICFKFIYKGYNVNVSKHINFKRRCFMKKTLRRPNQEHSLRLPTGRNYYETFIMDFDEIRDTKDLTYEFHRSIRENEPYGYIRLLN